LGKQTVLNLGFTNWDSRTAVEQNRRALQRACQAERMTMVSLRQVHSDSVVSVSVPNGEAPPCADAAMTRAQRVLLAVQTADCVPILLADRKHHVVAAVHAGWRGTLSRVVEKTLGKMRFEYGTKPAEVLAAIGPAIGRCCYEVGAEVAQAYLGQFAEAAEWFDGPFERLSAGEDQNWLPWLTMMPPGHTPPPERVRLDLKAANVHELISAGVKPANVAVTSLCTACRTDLLFSYRREGPETGRMMAVIGIA
jgi:YfiH family protein